MVYVGQNGTRYEIIDQPIGSGGEGSIHRIQNNLRLVAKVFTPANRNETRLRKLQVMLNCKISESALNQVTWPVDIIYDSNRLFVGYVMPILKSNENLNIMYSDKYICTLLERISMAKNLCAAVNSVHNTNQVIGDFNPKNISVNPVSGIVTLVDTDSYHITDPTSGRLYRCAVGMPEYIASELQLKLGNGVDLSNVKEPSFTTYTDLFALGIHLFYLLMNSHPFATALDFSQYNSRMTTSQPSITNPQPIQNIRDGLFIFHKSKKGLKAPIYAPDFDSLPPYIQKMFIACFEDGYRNPKLRPSAYDWYQVLDKYSKDLKTCSKNEKHMYYKQLKSCPWCAVENRKNGFNKAETPVITQTPLPETPVTSVPRQSYAPAITPAKTPVINQKTNNGNRGSNKGCGFVFVLAIVIAVIAGIVNSLGDYFNKQKNNDSNQNDYHNSTVVSEYEDNQDTPANIVYEDIYAQSPTVITYTGSISDYSQSDSYSFQTLYPGNYYVGVRQMDGANRNVSLHLYDSSDYMINSRNYCNNSGMQFQALSSGATYSVTVGAGDSFTDYVLDICMPKTVIECSGDVRIHDSIEYQFQENRYLYTPDSDGNVEIILDGIESNCSVDISVYYGDEQFAIARDRECNNGESLIFNGTRGAEYRIFVSYTNTNCNYQLLINSD